MAVLKLAKKMRTKMPKVVKKSTDDHWVKVTPPKLKDGTKVLKRKTMIEKLTTRRSHLVLSWLIFSWLEETHSAMMMR